MRICFLTDIREFGGGEVWTIRAGTCLKQLGHGVAVAAPLRSPLHHAAHDAGFDLFCFDRDAGSPFVAPFAQFLRRQEIDVLYCTLVGGFWEAATLKAVARQVGGASRRLAIVLKTGLPPLSSSFPGFYGIGVGSELRRLHLVSESDARAFRDRFRDHVSEDFFEVYREGIDLDAFDPDRLDRAACREEFGFPARAALVTCVSRLLPVKGQDHLLLAGAELKRAGHEFVLAFAGDGPDKQRLEALADHLGLADRTSFLGRLDPARIPGLLAASDIVCHPSSHDGLPNALVEAAAMGLPVVASDIAGIPEVVAHESSGLLVPNHDIRALQQSLDRLLNDPGLRERLGRTARLRIRRDFDLHDNVRRLVRRLEEEHRAFTAEPVRLRSTLTSNSRAPGGKPLRVLFLLNAFRTGGEET